MSELGNVSQKRLQSGCRSSLLRGRERGKGLGYMT